MTNIIARYRLRNIFLSDIANIKPDEFLLANSDNHIVSQILSGKAPSLAHQVANGIEEISKLKKQKDCYFDLTPKYGELVKLFKSPVSLCCKNKKQSFWTYVWATCLIICITLQLLGMLGLCIGTIFSDSGASVPIRMMLVGLTIALVFMSYIILDIASFVFLDLFSSFFQYAPVFWNAMQKKAEEIDQYIAKSKSEQSKLAN